MPAGRVFTVLVRRAVFLSVTLVVIVFLTALIVGATGYESRIWNAIVLEQVRAYQMSLQAKQIPQEEMERLVSEFKERLIKAYGLDKPWHERILPMAKRTLMLDLGMVQSEDVANVAGLVWPASVKDTILAVLPRTIIMITVAEIICAAIALPLGPFVAYRRGTLVDKIVVSYAALFNAVPVWWLAMIAIFLFGYELRIAPTNYRAVMAYLTSFSEDPLGSLKGILYYAYVPILIVVIAFLGSWLYSIRAVSIRVVSEDFVSVAKAKGLPEKYVVRRYVLRVVVAPVITYVILSLAGSIGGFIITESVFDWPGMGTLYWVSITSGDAATILGLVYVTTLIYVIARFILEVLYVVLDPRVRL